MKEHYGRVPRVVLLYAVEGFSKERRRRYLKGEVG